MAQMPLTLSPHCMLAPYRHKGQLHLAPHMHMGTPCLAPSHAPCAQLLRAEVAAVPCRDRHLSSVLVP